MKTNIIEGKSYTYAYTMHKERLEYLKRYSNDLGEALRLFEAETALIARYLTDIYFENPTRFRRLYHLKFEGKSPANYKHFVDGLMTNKAPKLKQLIIRKDLYEFIHNAIETA